MPRESDLVKTLKILTVILISCTVIGATIFIWDDHVIREICKTSTHEYCEHINHQ